jgi:hypothetical protein
MLSRWNTTDETVLHTDRSVNDSIAWAKRYTRRDLGGYECVEVCRFHFNGEIERLWHISREND